MADASFKSCLEIERLKDRQRQTVIQTQRNRIGQTSQTDRLTVTH